MRTNSVLTHRATKATRRITMITVWTVMAFLSFGLSRLMVVCTGPHCERRLEFVHDSGACCDHDRARLAVGERSAVAPEGEPCGHDHGGTHDHPPEHGLPAHGGGTLIAAGCGGCVDVALALDEAPLPAKVKAKVERSHTAHVCFVPSLPDAIPDGALPLRRTATTGPPRTDRRVELRAVTVLVL